MYFEKEQTERFIPTGSTNLDLILGGGWARGRVINIVGDKSSGKSLLAIQGCGNNQLIDPKAKNEYIDAEHVDVIEYFNLMNVPTEGVTFPDDVFTVEDYYNHVEEFIEKLQKAKNLNSQIILDSLDALSDEAELERKIDDGSYGGAKAKKMSELFRRLNASAHKSNITLMVVSQIRDVLNSRIPNQKSRSGGHALDFYASQIVWLTALKPITRTVEKEEEEIGIEVKAVVKKNKIAIPHKTCEFKVIYQLGVDNLWSCLEWLAEREKLELVPSLKSEEFDTKTSVSNFGKEALTWNKEQRDTLTKELTTAVIQVYTERQALLKVNAKNY